MEFAVNVREASDEDVDIVIDVLREASHWLEARGLPMWYDDELASEEIASQLAKRLFFIAEFRGDAAGVIRFQLEDALFWPDAKENESAYVHRFAVRRKYACT